MIMGILGSLEDSPAFKAALSQLGTLLPAVLGEVMGNGGQGGLSAIVAKLQQAGFGDQVKSWIGTGQNLPITDEQLQQVLGSDTASNWRRGSISRWIKSPKFWRSNFPKRWMVQARTVPFQRPHNAME